MTTIQVDGRGETNVNFAVLRGKVRLQRLQTATPIGTKRMNNWLAKVNRLANHLQLPLR
jgi:hypothetical protein